MTSAPHGALSDEPGFHLHDDQGPRIDATMIVLVTLSFSFVLARLLSRHLARAGYWVSSLCIQSPWW